MKCTETRRSTLFWILLTILLVCLIAGIVLITLHALTSRPLAGSTPAPRPEPQTETPRQQTGHGGFYYYAGMPVNTNFRGMTNIGFVVGYDDQRKNPAWVCYRLFAVTNFNAPPPPRPGFKADTKNYKWPGYEKGHMAPNKAIAVCYGTNAQRETFGVSNIILQTTHLNEGVWKQLERVEFLDYAQQFTQVWVIAGPIFGPKPKTNTFGVQMPEKCFKMIVKETDGQPQVLAFIIPQSVSNEQPAQFLTSVDEIEKQTGLDFFSELTNGIQEQLEAEVAKGMWSSQKQHGAKNKHLRPTR